MACYEGQKLEKFFPAAKHSERVAAPNEMRKSSFRSTCANVLRQDHWKRGFHCPSRLRRLIPRPESPLGCASSTCMRRKGAGTLARYPSPTWEPLRVALSLLCPA